MNARNKGSTVIELAVVCLLIASAGGWIANIVKLVGSGFDPITGLVVARVVGIFVAPLGSVLGFI